MKHVMLFAGLACVGATISTPPIAWTIAGSDAGGGAGIQADLAAFRALGVHGCSAITALTAQNSVEVRMVEYPSIEMLRTTLAALRDDLPAGAIKIGMTGREWVIREVADFLTSYKGPVVCDPVMVSTSGRRLLDADASAALISKLFPRCALITPNLPEAEALLGRKLRTPAEGEWCPIFCPTYNDPGYRQKVEPGFNWGDWPADDQVRENALCREFDVDLEYLRWRRSKIQETRFDFARYNEEFPDRAHDAFMATTQGIVSQMFIDRARAHCKPAAPYSWNNEAHDAPFGSDAVHIRGRGSQDLEGA